MRYWVYINDKVDGPYEEDKLVTLQGFTPDTLICAEEIAAGGSQEWVKASSIFEFDQVQQPANQPLPAEEVFNTQTAHSEPLASEQTLRVDASDSGDVNKLLLEKIDFLTAFCFYRCISELNIISCYKFSGNSLLQTSILPIGGGMKKFAIKISRKISSSIFQFRIGGGYEIIPV